MADIDEISRAIGGLQKDADNAAKSRDVIYSKLEEISRVLHEIKASANETKAALKAMDKRVTDTEEVCDDYQRTKMKGLLFLVGTGGAAGAGGTWLFDWVRSIWPG